MSNALDGMYGDNSVQAHVAMVMCRAKSVAGVDRTIFSGIILHDMNIPKTDSRWMRWRGSAILIPNVIERSREPTGHRIDQMLTGFINIDMDNNFEERSKKNSEGFWQPVWWSDV